MIATRRHYIIDILMGGIFGHYVWLWSERISYMIDEKILNMSFKERFPMFPYECGRCKAEININVQKAK
jgi:hypothetical protein